MPKRPKRYKANEPLGIGEGFAKHGCRRKESVGTGSTGRVAGGSSRRSAAQGQESCWAS